MRSRNHILPSYTNNTPRTVGQNFNEYNSQMKQGMPLAVMIFRTTTAFRWCCGTGSWFLLNHTLSPRTALELQRLVVFGFLNTLGFIQVQKNTDPIGIRLYHPNHTRLHIASARTGNMMNRVQTLPMRILPMNILTFSVLGKQFSTCR